MLRILVMWLWSLWQVRRHLHEVDTIRLHLESGIASTDEPPQEDMKLPVHWIEDKQVKNYLSALISLHYNVISLNCQ